MQAVQSPHQRCSRVGFTLVEATVVASIVGMLLAVSAPNWLPGRDLARKGSGVAAGPRSQIRLASAVKVSR